MRIVLVAVLALVALATCPAAAQIGFGGGGQPPKVPPRKEDLPYIRCQACELLAKNAYKQVRDMLKKSKPGKQVRCSRRCVRGWKS